jgi:hypothetical protein
MSQAKDKKETTKESIDNLDLTYRSNGKPYANEMAAQLRAGQLAKAGRQVEPVELEEGGFAFCPWLRSF